jgi:hypothetical protein
MPSFTQTEDNFVKRAYEQAERRIEDLIECNHINESKIRQTVIDTLFEYLAQIYDLRYQWRTNFSPDEINAIIEAARQLNAAQEALDNSNDYTLMELTLDLAQVLQNLSLEVDLPVLTNKWAAVKRSSPYPIPDVVPEDVRDEFTVGMFTRIQGRLNSIAYKIRDIAWRRCLNSDDYYPPRDFTNAVTNAINLSCDEAISTYLMLQKLRAAQRAAGGDELSIGGLIWDVIGWDSPYDFLIDLALTVGTGGVGKAVRWTEKVAALTIKLETKVGKVEKTLKIVERARRIEDRILEVRRAAERLKKAKNILELPRKLKLAFESIKTAEGALRVEKLVGETMTRKYIQNVASSFAAKIIVSKSPNVISAVSKELAMTSILHYLDGTPLGNRIKEEKVHFHYTLLIVSGFKGKNLERLIVYFALLVARQFIARMAIMTLHKFSWAAEYVIKEFIDSAGSALETLLSDMPLLSAYQKQWLASSIISTIRKTLGEIAKSLFAKLSLA